MIKSTLCYIRKDDEYLLLFRDKKKNDVNEGKWVGVGGKFCENESADECLLREVKEETGLTLSRYTFHGIVYFHSDKWDDEAMYLYSADTDEEELKNLLPECPEGTLQFVPKDEILNLPMWEGDRYFLEELLAGNTDIEMHLYYRGDTLVRKEKKEN
jgi:8-oxo-dGTP diphosphatase